MKLGVVGVALGALFTLTVATAAAGSRGVRITSLPGHVAQGGIEHLNAAVSTRAARCSLTVRYASKKKQALGRKQVITHRIAWTWRVPATAAVGKASARVSCDGHAAKTGRFVVKRRLVPASVTVTQSGLTQVPDGVDSGTNISYGFVLVNHSQDEDARDVEVDINFLDAAGNAVATDSQILLGGIRAGTNFYMGGLVLTNSSTVVTHMAAFVKVGESSPRSLVAPAVTNVRLSADPYDGTVILDGDVTNEATSNLSLLAEISAVYFNSAGKIVGGGLTFPPFALPPGAQTAFEIDTLGTPLASSVAQAKVSVDPDYGDL